MSRMMTRTHYLLLAAVVAAALAAAGSGSAATAGTKSFVLRLKKGSYRFVCDPHAGIMHGCFKVS
jgi:plastocyanin